ncbi:MAG: LacI family DNA-binding transcriptional regulator [Verrucomicrobia bacterium]|nr:LacI family DNA-binding transcriptional regulator [Verrucomicrobiota bacterium]
MNTIRQVDISRRLRISRSTVSAILNPRSCVKISDQTRRKVLRTVERLGYRPHRYAQVMRKGKSDLIGIVKSVWPTSSRYQFDTCAYDSILRSGYEPFVVEMDWVEHPERLQRAVNAALDARVEGVLFLGLSANGPLHEIKRLRQQRIPMVSLNGVALPEIAQVRSDVQRGMRELTRRVLSFEHRRVTLLTRLPTVPDAGRALEPVFCWPVLERIRGFQAAILEAGGRVELDSSLAQTWDIRLLPAAQAKSKTALVGRVMVEPPETEWHDLHQVGKNAMEKVLALDERPQAVLCHNDFWAIGALTACAAKNVRVPQDLSLTGFDGLPVSEYGSVPLTTANQAAEEMARRGVGILTNLIQRKKPYAGGVYARIPYQMVFRQSCAQPQV